MSWNPIMPRLLPVRAALICVFIFAGLCAAGEEESIEEANRLLRVTGTGELFDSTTREQTREIIRT